MKPFTSFFFLSTLCLLQHVALAASSKPSKHEAVPPVGAGPASRPGKPVSGNLLEEACKTATNKELCINTLKKDPNSAGADLTGLAFIALRLAAANAADVETHLRTLLIKNATGLDPEVQQGVQDCIDSYSDANEQLDDSVAALSEKNLKEIVTWVKVAIADSNYCESSIEGEATVISEKNKVFVQMCENALSVIKALSKK